MSSQKWRKSFFPIQNDNQLNQCPHFYEIEDMHTGDIICLSCGQLSPIYLQSDINLKNNHPQNENTKIKQSNNEIEEINSILDRIHVSTSYSEHIMKYYTENYDKKGNENLIMSIYVTLNRMGIKISLHELSLSTGVSKSHLFVAQKPNFNINICSETLSEKYCQLLRLDYKTITLIKEKLKHSKMTGHTPMTQIAGTIYHICNSIGKKISIKKIALITNISPISIQRYNKILKC
jgi:transcription initiation factor TFIIIB Brf1 subunit/transcription initiation factor TFIIB